MNGAFAVIGALAGLRLRLCDQPGSPRVVAPPSTQHSGDSATDAREESRRRSGSDVE